MHHSSDRDDISEIRQIMKEMKEPLGATNRFPEGKLTKNDEGEIRLVIAETKEGKVIIDFGTQVTWIGFSPEQAVALADSIHSKAKAILQKQKMRM